MDLGVAIDLDIESSTQRVDHGSTDAVQSAGGTVGTAAELATGMQLGQDDLDTGELGARLDVDRDAAPVVAHLDGAVGVQHDVDPRAVAGQRLVDGVVDDLPHAVHEPASVGRPDVHAGTLANGVEAFEDGQVLCGVGAGHPVTVAKEPWPTSVPHRPPTVHPAA